LLDACQTLLRTDPNDRASAKGLHDRDRLRRTAFLSWRSAQQTVATNCEIEGMRACCTAIFGEIVPVLHELRSRC
jgi:hypothetical protein